MTEETTMPAATPASETTMPADQQPAQETYHEQPAETPEHENYEEPADLGEILEDRPKKLSGAQRAKLQKEYLQNELRQREQRIEALERHINDENDRLQLRMTGGAMARMMTDARAIMVLTWNVSKTRGRSSRTLMPQCLKWLA